MATLLECARKDAIHFKRSDIEFNIPSESGIYFFWSKKFCVYIGQAVNLRERLLTHWSKSHNEDLNIWIRAIGINLCINYELVSRDLSNAEQTFIDRYQPHLNRINARQR